MTGPPNEVKGQTSHHRGRPSTNGSSSHTTTQRSHKLTAQAPTTEPTADSQQVSWWSVQEFVAAVVSQVNYWPMAGTPAWCSLAHDDPRKWAAVLDGGRHHALRLELNQEARSEASRAVSGAVDWSEVGREIKQRKAFYDSKPWLRRSQ
jgi:hypothetical protein